MILKIKTVALMIASHSRELMVNCSKLEDSGRFLNDNHLLPEFSGRFLQDHNFPVRFLQDNHFFVRFLQDKYILPDSYKTTSLLSDLQKIIF